MNEIQKAMRLALAAVAYTLALVSSTFILYWVIDLTFGIPESLPMQIVIGMSMGFVSHVIATYVSEKVMNR